MSPENGTPVALYARVSTNEQADHGVSLDHQVDRMRAYCELYDLDVVAVIRDEGASAKNLRRPGIRELEALIDGRHIRGVVVLKLDRLTRSVIDLAHLLERFGKRGIALSSVSEQLDTASAMGRFTTGIIALIAQWERETIGERTKDALAQLKRDGVILGAAPVGYDIVDRRMGKLVPNDRYEIVQRIEQLRDEGRSLQAIADLLNEEGVTTSRGAQWFPQTVSRALNARRRVANP